MRAKCETFASIIRRRCAGSCQDVGVHNFFVIEQKLDSNIKQGKLLKTDCKQKLSNKWGVVGE